MNAKDFSFYKNRLGNFHDVKEGNKTLENTQGKTYFYFYKIKENILIIIRSSLRFYQQCALYEVT